MRSANRSAIVANGWTKRLQVLRACWRDERVDFSGDYYSVTAMGMEPKPPQGAALPIWVGGHSPGGVASRRPIRATAGSRRW